MSRDCSLFLSYTSSEGRANFVSGLRACACCSKQTLTFAINFELLDLELLYLVPKLCQESFYNIQKVFKMISEVLSKCSVATSVVLIMNKLLMTKLLVRLAP